MARAPPFQTSCTLATSFFPLQLKSVQFNHIVSSNLVVKRLAFPLRVRFGFSITNKNPVNPRGVYIYGPSPRHGLSDDHDNDGMEEGGHAVAVGYPLIVGGGGGGGNGRQAPLGPRL